MKEKLLKMGIQEEKATEIMSLLNREISKIKESHKSEINSIKLENALEKAITAAGAKTGKAVAALIDREKISLDEKGELTGALEQLKALKENEDTKYLFNSEEDISFKGVNIGTGNNEEKAVENMSYDEICAYLEN